MREKCGVVGVYNIQNAAHIMYQALHAIQHRGQDSAGMVMQGNPFLRFVGKGIVNDVFTEVDLQNLKGSAGIGHARYGTAGGAGEENMQPLYAETKHGPIAVAHNGQIANFEIKRD
jgi:amidophosphoribosyltransferase